MSTHPDRYYLLLHPTMIGEIYINGVIGSFEDETGEFQKGVEVEDIITQYNKVKLNPIINVNISSPGGLVSEGNAIYDYLLSLKTNHTVNTKTTGNIGSIATKIFLVGQKRVISEDHTFMIHNPWGGVTGDSKALKKASKEMEGYEKELRNFYMAATDLSEAAIAPLMDKEATLSADQAIELGFATEKEKFKVLAFIKKEETMSTEEKGLWNKIKAIVKAQEQDDDEGPKNLLLELDGGSQVYVLTEDETLEGKSVVVAEGGEPTDAPAPDGDHLLADGRTITVAEGVITAVSEASTEPNEELEARITNLEESIATIAQGMQSLQASFAKKEEDDEKALAEVKNLINVGTVPKPKHKKDPASIEGASPKAKAAIAKAKARLEKK